ncbi:hypothetical protein MC885_014281 [Smutsia gigantea]|nr:hypothetical protein MC885_014281 [Smutsia gigantea]
MYILFPNRLPPQSLQVGKEQTAGPLLD